MAKHKKKKSKTAHRDKPISEMSWQELCKEADKSIKILKKEMPKFVNDPKNKLP